MSTDKQDTQMRDDVQELKFLYRKVVEPKLKSIDDNVQKIVDKDFVTREDADKRYATKEELEVIRAEQAKKEKYWFAFASALIGILTLAAYNLLTSGAIK